jgi:hypothetical protein
MCSRFLSHEYQNLNSIQLRLGRSDRIPKNLLEPQALTVTARRNYASISKSRDLTITSGTKYLAGLAL